MRRQLILTLFACVVAALSVRAQEGGGPEPVVIQRKKLALNAPDRYRIPISLSPSRKVTLTAAFDGVVKSIDVKVGQVVKPQVNLVRFDSERIKLVRNQAIAAKAVAEIELKQAKTARNSDQIKLAEARLALAEAELELAQFDESQTSVQSPYDGSVLKIHVQHGQRVQKGASIVTFANLSQLVCRIPVDRKSVAVGQSLELTVEDTTVDGSISAITELDASQQALRDLAVSVATAEVTLANDTGDLADGQAVFAALVPSDPVTRVPIESVSTASAGKRIVQILRDHVVRNIAVTLHGQVGTRDVFVSGAFSEGDEVIVSSSVELAELTSVRPVVVQSARLGSGRTASTKAVPAAGAKKATPKRKTDKAGF